MPRLAVLSLASCEDETNVTKVTNETTGMEIAVSVDSLGTCDLASVGKDGAGVVRFACGTSDTITLYKALCGDNAYDSAKSYCYSNDTANCTKYGHLCGDGLGRRVQRERQGLRLCQDLFRI